MKELQRLKEIVSNKPVLDHLINDGFLFEGEDIDTQLSVLYSDDKSHFTKMLNEAEKVYDKYIEDSTSKEVEPSDEELDEQAKLDQMIAEAFIMGAYGSPFVPAHYKQQIRENFEGFVEFMVDNFKLPNLSDFSETGTLFEGFYPELNEESLTDDESDRYGIGEPMPKKYRYYDDKDELVSKVMSPDFGKELVDAFGEEPYDDDAGHENSGLNEARLHKKFDISELDGALQDALNFFNTKEFLNVTDFSDEAENAINFIKKLGSLEGDKTPERLISIADQFNIDVKKFNDLNFIAQTIFSNKPGPAKRLKVYMSKIMRILDSYFDKYDEESRETYKPKKVAKTRLNYAKNSALRDFDVASKNIFSLYGKSKKLNEEKVGDGIAFGKGKTKREDLNTNIRISDAFKPKKYEMTDNEKEASEQLLGRNGLLDIDYTNGAPDHIKDANIEGVKGDKKKNKDMGGAEYTDSGDTMLKAAKKRFEDDGIANLDYTARGVKIKDGEEYKKTPGF